MIKRGESRASVPCFAGAILALVSFGLHPEPAAQAATSPYADVAWTSLSYPGLDCAQKTGNVPNSGAVVLETVKQLEVSNRATPLALVEVSCNLNHSYFNLFVFSPSTNGSQPELLQTLAVDQGTELATSLVTSTDSITATLAGYTPNEPLCCPSVISKQGWTWDGSRFFKHPAVEVTRVVMPNLIGKSYGTAVRELLQLGIASFNNLSGNLNQHRVVRAQSPRGGTILRPPRFTVSVSAS